MRRILTALTAIVTTMSVPFISVAPAAASTPDLSSVTLDCSTYSWVPWAQELPLYTSSVTVTFQNCSSDYRLSDPLSSTFASTTAGDVDSSGTFVLDTVTIDGEVELYILDETASMYAILDFVAP